MSFQQMRKFVIKEKEEKLGIHGSSLPLVLNSFNRKASSIDRRDPASITMVTENDGEKTLDMK